VRLRPKAYRTKKTLGPGPYREKTHKTRDWRQLGAKVNGKTRDFCEVRAILNEETRHSHKRDSANPVKMHAKVTSYSENPAKLHSKICKQIHKTLALRQLGAKINGKTRDFYDAHPRFIEKTRHSHKRLSENTIK